MMDLPFSLTMQEFLLLCGVLGAVLLGCFVFAVIARRLKQRNRHLIESNQLLLTDLMHATETAEPGFPQSPFPPPPEPKPETPVQAPEVSSDSGEEIKLTIAEVHSNYDRVAWAEGLILQLPKNHDGRNNWLFNYGRSIEAVGMRSTQNVAFDDITKSARLQ